MRKVTYYYGGVVADFMIPDTLYDAFAERVVELRAGAGEDLEKARRVLARAMAAFARDEAADALGDNERIAACYVWHYFNTTDEETRIEGDVLIADQHGDGEEVAYMPLADVELVREEE
ncbi:MAG: hypothetical protein H3C38_17445 [Rhodospirillales bacterium]|nr:hypothetical protein [Rhodospirillales bacterium]